MKSKRSTLSRDGNARRSALKRIILSLLGAAVMPVFPLSLAKAASVTPEGKKILVVYYSRSGNTREIAAQIRNVIPADVVELKTMHPYPSEYRATTAQAKQELESGFLPPLRTKIENISQYGVVIIGSPNWWSTMAMPVRTFLSEYDLAGKTVALFITHEGSRLGRSMEDLKGFCPNSTILEGLAVRGSTAGSAQDEVREWLGRIGLAR